MRRLLSGIALTVAVVGAWVAVAPEARADEPNPEKLRRIIAQIRQHREQKAAAASRRGGGADGSWADYHYRTQ
jgi:hypothetical protein